MRNELIAARKNEAVRAAAKEWLKAKIIDEPAAAEITAASSDDWHRRSRAWQGLIFFFSYVVVCAFLAFVALTLKLRGDAGIGVFLLCAGVLLFVATEIQSSVLRFDGVGSESATSFLAITFLFSSAVLCLVPALSSNDKVRSVLLALVLGGLCGISAWRRGYPLYALAAAVSLLAAVIFDTGGNRVFLLSIALLLGVPAESMRGGWRIPLSHRMSLACVSGAGLAAIYAAVNLYSLDHRLIEQLTLSLRSPEPPAPGAPSGAARVAAAIATAAFPLVLLALGLRSRRRLLLDAGLVFGALSLVTVRAYVHLGPIWLVLCESGVALTITTLLVERYLRRQPGGERAGLTAEPELASGGAPRGVEVAAAIWNLAPSAAPPKPQGPVGGGGSFGGGGATGGY